MFAASTLTGDDGSVGGGGEGRRPAVWSSLLSIQALVAQASVSHLSSFQLTGPHDAHDVGLETDSTV